MELTSDSNSDELLVAVFASANRLDILAELESLYRHLQDRTIRQSPRCDRSGRCCRFDEYGHRLYVTTIELAEFVRGLAGREVATRGLTGAGGCPFQEEGLCSVHDIRPFGCRLFYCDPTSAGWQEETYRELHARIRHLHERFLVPYHYIEWRRALRMLGLPNPGRQVSTGKSFSLPVLSRDRRSL